MPSAWAAIVRLNASAVMKFPSWAMRASMSMTGTPSGVTIDIMPGTFSITNAFGLTATTKCMNSNTRLLRGSIVSLLPAIEKAWHGGPPNDTPGLADCEVQVREHAHGV